MATAALLAVPRRQRPRTRAPSAPCERRARPALLEAAASLCRAASWRSHLPTRSRAPHERFVVRTDRREGNSQVLRAAAARPKLSLVTPAASSSRHRSRASLCEGSRMCCTVTSRVASFTFPTTSSSQLIAGAAGIRRHATARAVGGIAMKQATSIAFDDSRHRSAARRMSGALARAPVQRATRKRSGQRPPITFRQHTPLVAS